jgi:hypothetical protein
MRRSTQFCSLCLVFLLPFIVGCRSVTVFSAAPDVRWSGMGLSFSLPDGAWRVEKTDDVQGRHFASKDDSRHIVVMRAAAREKVPGWLRIQDFLVDFRDKELLEHHAVTLAEEATAEFAEYLVKLDDRDIRMGLWVVRRSGSDIVFAAWDSSGGPVPDLLGVVRSLDAAPVGEGRT